jgi:hypothetical protein
MRLLSYCRWYGCLTFHLRYGRSGVSLHHCIHNHSVSQLAPFLMRPHSPEVKGLECEAVTLSCKIFIKTTTYSLQHMKLGSDQMKSLYSRLANCTSYNEDNTRFYRPTRMKVTQASVPIEGLI